jgi:hypothetical protein
MSNLTEHAQKELELAGMFDEDSDYDGAAGKAVMELVETFSAQGHSGMSAGLVLALFDKVARFQPLAPISSDPEEWNYIADEIDGQSIYQNRRRSTTFSRDGGKTWYDIDDSSFNSGDTWFSVEDTLDYLHRAGFEKDDPFIILDHDTKARIWDELYELQVDWRKENNLPDDGSITLDAELNRKLRGKE